MDCGAACLATLCRYYGKRVSLNRMRTLARVGTAGASMLHLMHAARELGFEAQPILSTLEHLRSNHLPALINWKGYHWIVVYAVHDTRVVVADPGRGRDQHSHRRVHEVVDAVHAVHAPDAALRRARRVAAHARAVRAVSRSRTAARWWSSAPHR